MQCTVQYGFVETTLTMHNVDTQGQPVVHAVIELHKLAPGILCQTCQAGRVSGECAGLYDTNLIWTGFESGISSKERIRLLVFRTLNIIFKSMMDRITYRLTL